MAGLKIITMVTANMLSGRKGNHGVKWFDLIVKVKPFNFQPRQARRRFVAPIAG
jgi:hypothetical protein